MSISVEEQRQRARNWAAQNLGVGRTNLTGVLTSIPRQNIAHEREMEYERNINREMDLRHNQQGQRTEETNSGHYNRMHDIAMRLQNANNNNNNNNNNQGGRNRKKSRKSKKCKRKSSRRRFRKNHSKKYK